MFQGFCVFFRIMKGLGCRIDVLKAWLYIYIYTWTERGGGFNQGLIGVEGIRYKLGGSDLLRVPSVPIKSSPSLGVLAVPGCAAVGFCVRCGVGLSAGHVRIARWH